MSKISRLTAEIVREREKIWQEAPPELEGLKSQQKGRAGNITVRVYAFADAYRHQRNLWLLRDGVKNQNLTIEIAKSVLAPFLREMADRFEIWTLYTPSRLFREVESLLAEVTTAAELTNLLDELLIYNNRWWLWLDSCIPWFDLDRKL
jgi:phosphoglycolate phosphatase-like HAD superfamily hydrolase